MARVNVLYWPTSTLEVTDLHQRFSPWLNKLEMSALGTLVKPDDQREYLAAHVLLRRCLGRLMGCDPSEVGLVYESNGRPYTIGIDIPFSITHCRGMAACAYVSDTHPPEFAVGVDAEPLEAAGAMTEVAGLLLNHQEREWVMATADPDQTMLELWTVKEAILKARGSGFQTGSDSPFQSIESNPPTVTETAAGPMTRYHLVDGTVAQSIVAHSTHLLSVAAIGLGDDAFDVRYQAISVGQ